MLDSIIRDAPSLDLAVIDCVLDGSPAVQTGLFATVGRMEQEEVNVAKPCLVDRSTDGLAGRLVCRVGGELGSEVHVLTREGVGVSLTLEKVDYGFARLALVMVHLS